MRKKWLINVTGAIIWKGRQVIKFKICNRHSKSLSDKSENSMLDIQTPGLTTCA